MLGREVGRRVEMVEGSVRRKISHARPSREVYVWACTCARLDLLPRHLNESSYGRKLKARESWGKRGRVGKKRGMIKESEATMARRALTA